MITMEQLLFISDQYEFMRQSLPKLYEATRDHILLANKKLPVFVRALLPHLTDLAEFRRHTKDEAWMKQVILMCKPCFNIVNRKFYEQAEQFERLEQVQNEFQERMLQIVRGGRIIKSARKTNQQLQVQQTAM